MRRGCGTDQRLVGHELQRRHRPRKHVEPDDRAHRPGNRVGYDNVDLAACSAHDVAVVITPDGVRRPVAVSILTLIFALAGKLFIKDRLARRGPAGWAEKTVHNGIGLVGLTLGSISSSREAARRMCAPCSRSWPAASPTGSSTVTSSTGRAGERGWPGMRRDSGRAEGKRPRSMLLLPEHRQWRRPDVVTNAVVMPPRYRCGRSRHPCTTAVRRLSPQARRQSSPRSSTPPDGCPCRNAARPGARSWHVRT